MFNGRTEYFTEIFVDRWIVVDAATIALAERLAPRLGAIEGYIYADCDDALPESSLPNLISYETLLNSQRDDHEWPELDERSASIMCYTSGTTGDPKGIVYSHRSIVLASLVGCLVMLQAYVFTGMIVH